MAIECDHPRPELNLPSWTPPRLQWQVPSYLSRDPDELRRQLLAALQGIYNEQTRRFATPTVVPLFDEAMDVRPGQVVRGIGNGQTLNLLPVTGAVGPGTGADPFVLILPEVQSPVTVALPDGTSRTISNPGAHTFWPDDAATAGAVGGPTYVQPPGDASPIGSGVSTDRLLGRDTAGTGAVEEIEAGGGLEFSGSQSVQRSALTGDVTAAAGSGTTSIATEVIVNADVNPLAAISLSKLATIADDQVLVNVVGGAAPAAGRNLSAFGGDNLSYNATTHAFDVDLSAVTYLAGDGLDLTGLTFSVDVSDFAGSGLEDDGAENIRIASAAAGAGLTGGSGSALAVGAGDGITVNANDVAVNASDIAGTGLTVSSNNLNVDFSSVTYTAGDGLDLGSNQFSVDVSDFAGFGLEDDLLNNLQVVVSDFSGSGLIEFGGSLHVGAGDGIATTATEVSVVAADLDGAGLETDGANNLRISSSAAGVGLTGGSGSALSVNVSDIAGAGLEDDGFGNLRISTAAAGGGLGGGGGSALFVQSSIDTNARVGVREGTGTTFLRRRISFIEGSNVSIGISDDAGSEEVDVTISATNTTYSAGDGIDLAGTTFSADVSDFAGSGLIDEGANNLAVGAGDGIDVSANTVAVDVSDFAGAGIEDDGANNLRIASSAAGNGLTGGGGSALAVGAGDGISVSANSIAVDVSDFAGTDLQHDGNNNLELLSSINANARVGVRADSGGSTFMRRRINFIAGAGIEINISDDAGSEEVDVTITSTGL